MPKALVTLFLDTAIGYYLFYSFFGNFVNRKLLLKWFFIIYAMAILISTINIYYIEVKWGNSQNIDEIVGVACVDSIDQFKTFLNILLSLNLLYLALHISKPAKQVPPYLLLKVNFLVHFTRTLLSNLN